MLPNLGGPPKFGRRRQLCFTQPVCHECLVHNLDRVLRDLFLPGFIVYQVGTLKVNNEFKIKTSIFISFYKTTKEYFTPHGGISPALRRPTLGSWPRSWLQWDLPLLVRLGGGEGAVFHQVAAALAPAI